MEGTRNLTLVLKVDFLSTPVNSNSLGLDWQSSNLVKEAKKQNQNNHELIFHDEYLVTSYSDKKSSEPFTQDNEEQCSDNFSLLYVAKSPK